MTKKWRVLISLAPILALLLAVAPPRTAPVLAQPPAERPSFVDGHWQGSYYVVGSTQIDTMLAIVAYSGKLDFLSRAGDLQGEYDFGGSGVFLWPDGGTGEGAYQGGGRIFGPSDGLEMKGTNLEVDITVNVGGIEAGASVIFGPEDSLPFTILLVSATCSYAVGDIETPVIANVQSVGGQIHAIKGSFSATRVEDLAAEENPNYYIESAQLLYDVIEFGKQAEEQGGIDFDELEDLLERAEDLARAVKRNTECGLQDDPAKYLSPISMAVAQLAAFALHNAELFNTAELRRLIIAALRTGTMGAGAVNAETAKKLEEGFLEEVMARAYAADALAQEGFLNNEPGKVEAGCAEMAAGIATLKVLGADPYLIATLRYDTFCTGNGGG
jgi:hypothetical protein